MVLAMLFVAAVAGVAVTVLGGGGDGGGEQGDDAPAARYSDGVRPASWPPGLKYPGGGVAWTAAERRGSAGATFATTLGAAAAASAWRAELRAAGYEPGPPAKVGPGVWVLGAEGRDQVITATFVPFPDPEPASYQSLVSVGITPGG